VAGGGGETGDPWAQVPAILARIPALVFPARDYLVTAYGAMGNGRTDDHAALLRAIAACADEGGGRVVVPPGEYLTGPLRLRSRVNLHLCAGATLRFVADSCRYLPPVLTRWEGVECMGLSPFIYAHAQQQVAVTGDGALDGQAGPGRWWDWAGPWDGPEPTGWTPEQPHQRAARHRLQQWAEAGVPVSRRVVAPQDLLRPMFIQFYRCRDVLVEGVTLRNIPMWGVHPVFCRAVTVRRIRVISHGPNNDGCVPDSSRDVLVEDCLFDTGDDCIAIKAGRNRDGRRVHTPAEDIVIRGCRMREGHSAIAIGSEISGGVRRVFIERCTLDRPRLDHALRIKANSTRGGIVELIRLRDAEVAGVRESALRVDLLYDANEERGERLPQVRDVQVERLACGHGGRAVWIEGLPGMPVRDVCLSDCVFRRVDAPDILRHVEGVTLRRVAFPPPA
jgi:polygalacturonase